MLICSDSHSPQLRICNLRTLLTLKFRINQRSRLVVRFRSSSASPRSLARPVCSLFRSNAFRPINCVAIPSNSASVRVLYASSKLTPEMAVKRSIRFGFTPNWTTMPGAHRSVFSIPSLPKPNSDKARKTRVAFLRWASPVDRDPQYSEGKP
jgi:hypothetical protein